jgi:hypothetical protein
MRPREAHCKFMKGKGDLTRPKPGETWTRPEDYFVALARRRSARKAREPKRRTQTDQPHFLLSTLPFLLLFIALAVITIGIVLMAWPGNQPQPKEKVVAESEQGVAAKGWFQKAQKEFH